MRYISTQEWADEAEYRRRRSQERRNPPSIPARNLPWIYKALMGLLGALVFLVVLMLLTLIMGGP